MKKGWFRRILYRINPRHKDRLFCTMYGTDKYKHYALELYNAINGTHYTRPSELEIITLEDAVYIKMKNDVAYLVSDTIAIYEHQSTVNQNMPLRGFMYSGELYSKILKRNRARIYNKKLIKIPTPQYIVFYNGTESYPECSKLRLSDAFINPTDNNEFEFTATVYNINLGKNKELLDSCESLKGYSYFVEQVRINALRMPLEQAVDEAVKDCIESDILRDVLSEERSAVMLEMLTTFDEKAYEEGLREEGREEERANTEREMHRADIAEERADAAEARIKELEAELVARK